MNDSLVIPFTRSSSSSQDRSVPGPRWIRPMSFELVNQQHRHALLCRHDLALQEVTNHMHGGQTTGCQGLDSV
jgi:hypothetical protein